METILFKGNICHIYGTMPRIGDTAPCFTLVTADLKEISCSDFVGRKIIMNIFPSLDTDTCASSVRHFNEMAAKMPHTTVLCISMDLPFAQKRFCVANGIDNVVVASAFRSPTFWEKYGIKIIDGPLAGLLARSIIMIDENFKVIYTQLVEEISNEPDYEEVLQICAGK